VLRVGLSFAPLRTPWPPSHVRGRVPSRRSTRSRSWLDWNGGPKRSTWRSFQPPLRRVQHESSYQGSLVGARDLSGGTRDELGRTGVLLASAGDSSYAARD